MKFKELPPVCPTEKHEAMKTPSQWPKLAFRGIQKFPGKVDRECRNCHCGSTLMRPVDADKKEVA